MTEVIALHGTMLDRANDLTHLNQHDILDPHAHRRLCAAQLKTPWGSRCQRPYALVDGAKLLACAMQYDLVGTLDGRSMRICGIGSVATHPAWRGRGHARTLVETVLDGAARQGAEMALLFLRSGVDDDVWSDFDAIPLTELTLQVVESPRRGAPMTMVRGGDERDLAAIAAMGRVRAEPFRFHLDRDADLVQYAITRTRLLAGLDRGGARQLQFFIAEEGVTAAAYVVVSIVGDRWTLEECGDRDPSGARVGALLEALIAREPAERRPTIHGWLPPRFRPPQVAIVPMEPPTDRVMLRVFNSRPAPPLSVDDVVYWRSDVF